MSDPIEKLLSDSTLGKIVCSAQMEYEKCENPLWKHSLMQLATAANNVKLMARELIVSESTECKTPPTA